MIPWGVQYSCLLPKITMLHNHWVLLVDLHMGDPFPLVPVGDFQLEDTIFPGTPGDSLLYNSEDLAKLCRLRFQVATHRTEQTPIIECREEKSQSSCSPGKMPSSTSENGEPSKSRGNPLKPPHQRQPLTLQTGRPRTTTNVLHLLKNTMDPATKAYTVPSTGTNSPVRVASPHRNAQHPHHRSCPPLHGWRGRPLWKGLPRSFVPHPRVVNSMSQTISTPSPAPPVLQLLTEQKVGYEADQFPVMIDIL